MEKTFQWREEKNAWLMSERGVRFEEIVEAIARGKLLGVRENRRRSHPRQRVFIVKLHGYKWSKNGVVIPSDARNLSVTVRETLPERPSRDASLRSA